MNFILWTIRCALACYAVSLVALIDAGTSPRTSRLARAAWTLGFVFFALHVAAAFHFVHRWSHGDAFEHTARRTDEVVGIAFGYGIYVNYFFMLVWLLDVAWWWLNPAGYRRRPRWVTDTLHAFFAFIVFNATVVFGVGPIRWIGLAGTIALALFWMARRPRAMA